MNPVEATEVGLATYDHRVGSFTEEDVREHIAALKSIDSALEEVSLDDLEDEIDRTALVNTIRVTIHRFIKEKPHVRNPEFWLSHMLEGLYLLLARADAPHEHRSRAAASRLSEVPKFLELAAETLGDCPKVLVETALQVIDGGRSLIDQVAVHLRPTDDPQFDMRCAEALAAMESFTKYMRDDLLRSADCGYAIGEDSFNYRLRFEHALGATAPELWRYGVHLIEKVQTDLANLAREIDATVSWPDLVDSLRSDHPSGPELVNAYAEEMERAQRFVTERDLAPLPDGRLDVVETPSFLRPLVPYAAYQPPGAFSENRTGLFYVTSPDDGLEPDAAARLLRDHCSHELPGTALHEGYPGHHLQFLCAHAQPRTARKVLSSGLTVEGWALYCEDMMGEQGFYRTPEERLFQLVQLLWRAVRIVLDVGLHTRGMSVDEAVQVLVDRVHLERTNAEAEVRRYCAYPVYQACYALGRRELKSLRDAFEIACGNDYSLKKFHEAVLAYGGLPVSLMRWGMRLDE